MTDESVHKKERYLWALYNIPLSRQQGLRSNAALVHGEHAAINSWGHVDYDGPCLSQGKHRYMLRLYALKSRLHFNKTIRADKLQKAMHASIIATAKLGGWYGLAAKKAGQHKS